MNYDELIKELRHYSLLTIEPLHSELAKAADAIEELQGQIDGWIEQERKVLIGSLPKWIPVTERLPKPTYAREWYLVALESGCVKTLAYEKSGRSDNLFKDGWHETASPVTHWMPLPEPPKEDKT